MDPNNSVIKRLWCIKKSFTTDMQLCQLFSFLLKRGLETICSLSVGSWCAGKQTGSLKSCLPCKRWQKSTKCIQSRKIYCSHIARRYVSLYDYELLRKNKTSTCILYPKHLSKFENSNHTSLRNTIQPLYNTVHYNTVRDITRFKDGSQKCKDYIEKWP